MTQAVTVTDSVNKHKTNMKKNNQMENKNSSVNKKGKKQTVQVLQKGI